MNKKNLVTLSPSEARENGKKGGVKSGEARRRKRSLKEAMQHMLHEAEIDEDVREMLAKEGIDERDFTHTIAITRSLIAKAEAGDVSAYNAIRDILGEKPAEGLNVNIPSRVEVCIVESPYNVDFASSEDEVDTTRMR